MSEPHARSASLFSVLAVFIGLGLFVLIVRHFYTGRPAPMPYNVAAEGLPEDQVWKATAAGRAEELSEILEAQQEQADSYGWIDQGNGVIRLPLDRAMELSARELNSGPRP